MSQILEWSLAAKIPGGAQVAANHTIEMEAYGVIKLTVETGATVQIGLQPGTDLVKALIITSDHYGNDLSYQVNEDSNPALILDQPLVLMGEGAVSLLNPDADDDFSPTSLFVSNGMAEAVSMEFIVGRDATPEPASP